MPTHPAAKLRESPVQGRGLFAERDLRPGEVIWSPGPPWREFPESEANSWPEAVRRRFFRHSVQTGDDLHAGDPGDANLADPFAWTNHSCDANTWWDGPRLLVARRLIRAGEEITFDYATSETRADFGLGPCRCGAASCRGRIGPRDYRDSPAMRASYGEHVLPHVLATLGPGPARPWWEGGTLRAGAAGLEMGGRRVADLVRSTGTPVYLYDAARIRAQAARLRSAFGAHGLRGRVRYALKANRFPAVLRVLREEGDVGIDSCSPREVEHAFAAGFRPDEVTVTASSLTERDVAAFAAAGVHVNLDHPTAIRRYAARVPRGTRIGLRIDPFVQVGYGVNEKTAYAGGKLGLAPEAFDDAVSVARDAGLVVDTVHAHLGWGLREQDEPDVRKGFALLAELARRVPTIDTVNVGGGLGARLREEDRPLDPFRWAAAIADTIGPLGVTVACEPGTFLVADAGLLVVEVTAEWEKRGVRWIGVNAGHAVNVYAAHYSLPLEMIPAADPCAARTVPTSVAGNINESGDVFARGRPLPPLREGELVAFFPCGAYGSSMASDHCLRGRPAEEVV